MSNAFQVPAAFTVAAPVAEALAAGGPVVALETAVLTHGLPHPLGQETLRAMAAAVAAEGALPAVIGMLLAVPVPAGQAIGAAEVEAWVAAATAEATAAGASGQALTPWVLSRLAALSGGRTLAANRALLVNNGAVAGRVAMALGGT